MLEEIIGDRPVSSLSDREAVSLCEELRTLLIQTVAKTGGHLASNLGVVELTVALHRVFDTRQDRLVFDVGHQCYAHKILTGRADLIHTLRSFGGLSGFPKPNESVHDAFVSGHASTAVSVALGMARARTLTDKQYSVIALVGDGALTGGLAYEGLSNAGQSGEPLLVVLNDNGMSITRNVGGIAWYLARQRVKPQYLRFKKAYRKILSVLPGGVRLHRINHRLKQAIKEAVLSCTMFEDMGFTYLGPVDGHDVAGITRLLRWAKELNTPVLLHVRTIKGKGCSYAEANPDAYHGVGPFDPVTGIPKSSPKPSFSQVLGETLCDLAKQEPRICAITAAMQTGCGLDEFARRYPNRFFDAGIAEGHAAAMSGGMAKQGMIPVFAVYSTFLQRAYDMLLHDIALDNLHVVLAVDRAGLVGEDGETHQGIFDISYLGSIPNMTVLCPSSFAEMKRMVRKAIFDISGPVAVRYPRGGEGAFTADSGDVPSVLLRTGGDITLVGYGVLINQLLEAAATLSGDGVEADIVKLNTITPLDASMVEQSVHKTGRLLVLEDCVENGSVGQRLTARLVQADVNVKGITLQNLGGEFIPHGKVSELENLCGLSANSVTQAALTLCGKKAGSK